LARMLVTGAAGFIGRALCRSLAERGHAILGVTRVPAERIPGAELRPIGAIGPQTDWSAHLDHIDVVIHLANRAHRRPSQRAELDEAGTAAALLRAAAMAGVRRLVHMSSIRAMGDATLPSRPFRCTDPPRPHDAYGRTKLATENALQAVARATGIELVILRPPLVYGPGVKANFRMLMRLVDSGIPLPLAGIDNRRSLVFLDNLVDLATRASLHPDAAGRVWLVRDAPDLSTPELIGALAASLGRPARLFPAPQTAFTALRHLPYFGRFVSRLTLSLQVDDSETRATLDWRPPVSTQIGLALTTRAFRARL
jgi:nucleoside-diphosphate-sugar epimerase